MKDRFRGSSIVTIDDRGRIKVPSRYLSILNAQYDKQFYLTSLNGDHVLCYPLVVWEEIEQKIESIQIRDADVEEYVSRLSFWGSENELDPKGRILIPPNLRTRSQMKGEVLILGKVNYLEFWNRELFETRYVAGDFSDEKLDKVSRVFHELATLSRHA